MVQRGRWNAWFDGMLEITVESPTRIRNEGTTQIRVLEIRNCRIRSRHQITHVVERHSDDVLPAVTGTVIRIVPLDTHGAPLREVHFVAGADEDSDSVSTSGVREISGYLVELSARPRLIG